MFAGNIYQVDSKASGAVHVDSSNCFNRLTPLAWMGTVASGGSTTSLTFATTDGQVITLTGNFTSGNFAGTYRIDGGCAAGDQGNVTGVNIFNVSSELSGTFTNSAQETFNVTATISQNFAASPDGSFGITGTAKFDTPCFGAATLKPGTFPSGSFILGMSVGLEFETENGTLTFTGTLNQERGEMTGNYSVSGGSCNDSGTALLLMNPWAY
jgi:hypothetical protein